MLKKSNIRLLPCFFNAQVAVPLAFDQPYYGHRLETLGAGKTIKYLCFVFI